MKKRRKHRGCKRCKGKVIISKKEAQRLDALSIVNDLLNP